ncbi:MAG: RelA/SpoT family protein [Campylobacteraceae bacterium]|nr:RelA/SpoT family protein [Campylobacteraceae bacterium]
MIQDTHIIKKLSEMIEKEFARIGILFRVFSRVKSDESISRKINNNPDKYSENGKKIQDIYGLRITLYFPDDTPIAQSALENIFKHDRVSSKIDSPNSISFEAIRYNLIFSLPTNLEEESLLCKNPLVDSTFEVQLRTVLSEGWHEVEHDLRYKHKSDWEEHNDLNRALNGIYASLETADWSMMRVFEELSYRHYKNNEFEAMLRTKFRLRFQGKLKNEINDFLKNNENVSQRISEVNRKNLMLKITKNKINIPLTYNNLIFIINFYFIKNEDLKNLAPSFIIKHLEEIKI